MSVMDYDKNEPNHTPIIVSIIVTIVVILLMCYGLILYFKGELKLQENTNEALGRNGFDLKQLNQYENDFLNSKKDDKITIDDAIYLISTKYSN